jgi:hypothetical protein
MMYKKLIAALTGLLLLYSSTAQQLTPQTINNGGSSKTAGGIILEDALGGLLVNTVSTPVFIYTQDFLQPNAGTTTTIPVINNVVLNSGAGIDNAGTTFISSNTMLEFTVGEVACKTLNSSNNLLSQGILQPLNPLLTSLPVTNLQFYAKRLDVNKVQLNWQTEQEFNNKGFSIERKKESETNFSPIDFVNSKAAAGGNSFTPLYYTKVDNNDFRGKTFYRLKQEDLDGQFKYSVIRIVNGSDMKQALMQVWPVPSNGPVNIVVNGIDNADMLLVFDAAGKLVQQHTVTNNQQLQLNCLRSGSYILKLAKNTELMQRIVVH